MQNKRSGRSRDAAARPYRNTIGATVWAQSLGQMTPSWLRKIKATAERALLASTLPAAALWSDCAAWRGAAAGGDQRSAA